MTLQLTLLGVLNRSFKILIFLACCVLILLDKVRKLRLVLSSGRQANPTAEVHYMACRKCEIHWQSRNAR